MARMNLGNITARGNPFEIISRNNDAHLRRRRERSEVPSQGFSRSVLRNRMSDRVFDGQNEID